MRHSWLLLLLAISCSRRGNELPPAGAVDSIVLERTPCFGTCPSYRLSIARGGVVRFEERYGAEPHTGRDSLGDSVLADLARRASDIPLASLPDTIALDAKLCPVHATDHPTIVLGIFGATSKQVVYYTGCYAAPGEGPVPALEKLREFATAMDTLTRAARWIRPGRFR